MTVAAPLDHRYVPRGTQRQAQRLTAKEVVLSGPAGTGKSRALLEKLNNLALSFYGFRGLMVRKTRESLMASAMETFRNYVAKEVLANGDARWFNGSGSVPAQFTYPETGASIMVAGMKDEGQSTKVMSTEYDVIYVQEATELEESDWEMLTTRLRNGAIKEANCVSPHVWAKYYGSEFHQIIADCNPSTPTHWLKQRCDRGQTLMLNTQHEENPVFFDVFGNVTEEGKDYIATLDALTGVRYHRLRMGRWQAAEGIIYEDWDPAVHLIDPFEVPRDWRRWWSVDWGTQNPFVWQNWAENHDGVLYLTQEIYRSGVIVEDHSQEVLRLVQGQPFPDAIIADHDLGDRLTFERHTDLPTRAAMKDVIPGIEAVQVRLRKRRLFIFKNACVRRDQSLVDAKKPTCTADEIPGYIWHEPKTPAGITVRKEGPVKENDHGCDAMRYMVAHRDLVGSPTVRFL